MKKLKNMSRDELRQYAKDNGITVPFGTNSKAGILGVIESAADIPDESDFWSGEWDGAETSPAIEQAGRYDGLPVVAEDRVDIEYALNGYYVVKVDSEGNRLLEIKCETVNQAIRERDRLVGA